MASKLSDELIIVPVSDTASSSSSNTKGGGNKKISETCDIEKFALKPPSVAKPPYTTYTPSRQLSIVLIVTIAGFFSPLCGAVYLPSLILFTKIFHTTGTVINATVSVYMVVFAIAPLFGAAASDYGG